MFYVIYQTRIEGNLYDPGPLSSEKRVLKDNHMTISSNRFPNTCKKLRTRVTVFVND